MTEMTSAAAGAADRATAASTVRVITLTATTIKNIIMRERGAEGGATVIQSLQNGAGHETAVIAMTAVTNTDDQVVVKPVIASTAAIELTLQTKVLDVMAQQLNVCLLRSDVDGGVPRGDRSRSRRSEAPSGEGCDMQRAPMTLTSDLDTRSMNDADRDLQATARAEWKALQAYDQFRPKPRRLAPIQVEAADVLPQALHPSDVLQFVGAEDEDMLKVVNRAAGIQENATATDARHADKLLVEDPTNGVYQAVNKAAFLRNEQAASEGGRRAMYRGRSLPSEADRPSRRPELVRPFDKVVGAWATLIALICQVRSTRRMLQQLSSWLLALAS